MYSYADEASTDDVDGELILFELMQAWREAFLANHRPSFLVLEQYMRAFVQGHNIALDYPGTVATALQLLYQLAPKVMGKCTVNVQVHVYCDSCCQANQSYLLPSRFDLLYLQFAERNDWQDGETINYREQYQCRRMLSENRRCDGSVTRDAYTVHNTQEEPFVALYHRESLPPELWREILKGWFVYFGDRSEVAPMEVKAAVFEEDDGLFRVGWLKVHKKKKAKFSRSWMTVNLDDGTISEYLGAYRYNVVALWCGIPPQSCSCGDYNHFGIQHCHECLHWIHTKCAEETGRMSGSWEDWKGGYTNGCPNCPPPSSGDNLAPTQSTSISSTITENASIRLQFIGGNVNEEKDIESDSNSHSSDESNHIECRGDVEFTHDSDNSHSDWSEDAEKDASLVHNLSRTQRLQRRIRRKRKLERSQLQKANSSTDNYTVQRRRISKSPPRKRARTEPHPIPLSNANTDNIREYGQNVNHSGSTMTDETSSATHNRSINDTHSVNPTTDTSLPAREVQKAVPHKDAV